MNSVDEVEEMIPVIAPEHIKKEAQKKENENIKFRIFLKCHAKGEELDQHFLDLHNELAVEVCPVAFEIFERLKGEYRFRLKR